MRLMLPALLERWSPKTGGYFSASHPGVLGHFSVLTTVFYGSWTPCEIWVKQVSELPSCWGWMNRHK